MSKWWNAVKQKVRDHVYNVHRLERGHFVCREHVPISSLVDFNRAKELFSLIDATIIGKSRAYTLVLKDLYDPLNPDKDTVQTRQNISIEQYKSHFLGHLRPTLRKAKYNRVPQEIVESMAQYVEIPERGLQVKIKLKDYELVEMWYKGELFGDRARLASREPHESIWKFVESQYYDTMDNMRIQITRRIQALVAHFFKSTPIHEDFFFKKVVIILRPKKSKKLVLKSFKFVPRGSLQVLFPDSIKRMGSLNSLIMYSTVAGSFSTILWQYLTETALVKAYFVPISIVLYRFWYNYDYRRKRYDATMAHLLYNNNLSNNIGVVHEIIDQAENERFMSSILLYCALLHEDTVARGRPDFDGYSIEKIDEKIERWIKEFSKLKTHDFDEFTAIENLKKLKLLHPTKAGLYRAKILDLAIHDLERTVSTEIIKSVYSTKDELDWNLLVEKRPFSELYR